jgi:hypothetical protein
VTIAANTIGVYVFDGKAGQRVYVDELYQCVCVTRTLIDPRGHTLSSYISGDIETTLSVTGTYTVVLSGNQLTSTIATYFPVDTSTAVTPTAAGATTTISTPTPGQNAAITFHGTPGHRYAVAMANNTYNGGFSPCRVNVSVSAPDGLTVDPPTCADAQFFEPITVSQDGTYTVSIDPTADRTGTIDISVYDVPPTSAQSVVPTAAGAAVSVATTAGQNANVTFQGQSGQRIAVWVTNNTYDQTGYFATCEMSMTTANPDASALIGSTCLAQGGPPDWYLDSRPLGQNGTYTMTFDALQSYAGSATVYVYLVPADQALSAVPSQAGTPVTVTTSTGQNWSVSFQGTSGEQWRAPLTNSTYDTALTGGCDMPTTLRYPDGSASSLPCPGQSTALTLSQTGTYTLLGNPAFEACGSATVTMYDPAGPVTGGSANVTMSDPAGPATGAAARVARAATLRSPFLTAAPATAATASPHLRARGRRPALPAKPAVRFATKDSPVWTPGAKNYRGDWMTHRGATPWTQLPVRKAPRGVSALAGQALKLNGKPLAGVRVYVERTRLQAVTDKTGRFLIAGPLAKHVVLRIDGSRATAGGRHFASFEFASTYGMGARAASERPSG